MEEYIVPDRKRLPYGMMNFADIRFDNYYYVDKTMYIPMIEQADLFIFFNRPRGFGKSLTLDMLQRYYDIRLKDKFEALFGNLYIGKQPTRGRNSYLVLYLNFSGISDEMHNYRKELDLHCKTCFDYFCDVYAEYLPEGIKQGLGKYDGACNQLDYLVAKCELARQKIYLFIDEYDHFINAEGYLRAFFNKIKAGTYSSIKRCFITGVSPVTMDGLSSGFNIATNYSFSSQFNRMMGFTEEEVREMLTYYSTTVPFRQTVDELIEIMKPWYDNYCFAEECYGETTLYNSNMVLYFVKNYILSGKVPRSMVEDNIRIDYEKLRMLIRKDKEFAHDASVIQTLVSQGYITGELKKGFPAASIVDPDNFISLLYYFGYIADCLKRYASQRDKQKGESFVHGFTLAMTAQNRFYRPISEADTQAGYADIFLCPLLEIYPDMLHSYIVELKYAKYRDPESRVDELRLEGIAQANRYAGTDTVRNAVGTTRLHKIVVVYKGMEMRVCEEL